MGATHIDLFSGIGAWGLASRESGWRSVAFCEIDPFCQKILRKNFPDALVLGDIYKMTGEEIGRPVDVLSFSPPCQSFSRAGKGRGIEDPRGGLYWEGLRIINLLRPRWVCMEQVAAIATTDVIDFYTDDLDSIGYACKAGIIPACSVGTPHRRDRVWIVAHSKGLRQGRAIYGPGAEVDKWGGNGIPITGDSIAEQEGWIPKSGVGRDVDDVASWVDRVGGRIRGLKTVAPMLQSTLWPTPVASETCENISVVFARHKRSGFLQKKTVTLVQHPMIANLQQHPHEPPRVVRDVKNRAKRLKAIGNSIVWVIAYAIFQSIEAAEMEFNI